MILVVCQVSCVAYYCFFMLLVFVGRYCKLNEYNSQHCENQCLNKGHKDLKPEEWHRDNIWREAAYNHEEYLSGKNIAE